MSAPVDPQDNSPAGSSKPADNSRRLKIRNWLISFAVILVITVLEKVIEHHVSPDSLNLTEINKSFVKEVGEVNPFKLARVFYDYLLQGAPREPSPTLYGFPIPRTPEPPQSVGFGTVLWRIIPGAFFTARTIVSEGWVSTLTALVGLFLGFAGVWPELKKHESLVGTLYLLLLVPLIGSVFVWLLITIMWLAGLLFGWLLASAETIAYFGVIGTAVVKEKEHHVTGKIIARLTGQH